MNDKWKRRWLYIIAIAIFIIVVAGASALSVWTANIKRLIANNKPIQTTVIQKFDGKEGPKGKDGLSIIGPKGDAGKDGINALSTHTETTIIREVQLPAEKGDKGDNGEDAARQVTMVDYETCELLTRYENESTWTILAQLPKPCEPQQ